MEEDVTQQLQNIIDKTKTANLLQNMHNLTPPNKIAEVQFDQVAIIRTLESAPRLREIFLEARGLTWDEKKKTIVQITSPMMNILGAWKLVAICKKIAMEAEFGNFKEEDIPSYMIHFFNVEFPHFTFYHEVYDIDPQDFDYISTTIQMFLLGAFSKGKGGKYINLLGKTYSEDFMGKVLRGDKKKEEGFLDKINPLKKMMG